MSQPDAVLLLGHGSRIESANTPLWEMAERISGQLGVEVTCAFLQLAEPTLHEAAERLAARGRRRIAVMPFFLFTGAHVLEDVPRTFSELARRHPGVEFFLTKPLGMDPLLADIACRRVRERMEEEAS